jgi:hypothetical protein
MEEPNHGTLAPFIIRYRYRYRYMHKRVRVELYENYFKMKKEINKI